MSQPVEILLEIEQPLLLGPVNVVPSFAEPLFVSSEAYLLRPGDKEKIDSAMQAGSGPKSSQSDAGYFGQVSLEDDFLYICVKAGEAGSAVWKKTILFNT